MDEINRIGPAGVLDAFLGELRDLLASIVGDTTLLPANVREEFQGALDELDANFRAAREALTQEGVLERLQAIGLAGRQLLLKIAGWRRAFGRFRDQRGGRVARTATAWAALILGSLASIFPQVEAIKEITQAVDAALNDAGAAN